MMDHQNRLILNVGGTRFEAYIHTLRKIPATRLSRLSEQSNNFDPILNEYFFDRHPGVFPQIINYYRTGKLHYPKSVCGPLFEEELEFWGLDPNQVEPCCWMTYTKHRTTEVTLAALDNIERMENTTIEQLRSKFSYDLENSLAWHQNLRMWLWKVFDEPHSSFYAKVVTSITLFFVIMSVVIFNSNSLQELGTDEATIVPVYQRSDVINKKNLTITEAVRCHYAVQEEISNLSLSYSLNFKNHLGPPNRLSTAVTHAAQEHGKCKYGTAHNFKMSASKIKPGQLKTNTQLGEVNIKEMIPSKTNCSNVRYILEILDIIANSYLAIEVSLRFIVSPSKFTFLRSPINIIDVTASIWYFVIMFARDRFGARDNYILDFTSNIRVLRIFQMLHHHTGLRVIVASLETSAPVLYLFVFVFLISMIIGATMVYYAERTFANDTYRLSLENKSVFNWWWFAVVTSTTVGYGDYVPRTELGKLFGAYCAVIGVLAADVPMAIVVQTFSDFYKHQSIRAKLQHMQRQAMLVRH